MLKLKKQISVLLASVMMLASAGAITVQAEDYIYPDTTDVINGVEVIGEGLDEYWVRANPWNDHYAWLYRTHEAYEGNGAMLVQSRSTDNAWAANWKNDKTGMTAGVQYKIEYYVKPVVQINGEYTLPTAFRYYNDYTVLGATVYDTETGAEVTGAYESKWYRLESVFTATADMVTDWCGLSLPVSPGEVYIIDNISMYANTGTEEEPVWSELSDKIGVYNGDFEAGISIVRGLDPENVRVNNSVGAVSISWTNPQEQKTKIYNGDVLVATANEGETSITLSELDTAQKYVLTVKGAVGNLESKGVTVDVEPYITKYPDTTDVINGIEVIGEGLDEYWVRANPWNDHYAWLYRTHEAYEGNGAMLVQSRSTDNAWAANWKNDKTGITAGTQYKIEYYVKPVSQVNGEYTLPTAFKYYNDYTVLEAKVYDTETGAEVTGAYESKWYRLESVFTATASTAADWCGFSLPVSPGEVYIIDNLAMYANTGAEGNAVWTKLADKIGVYNGDFEAGISIVRGRNPENVKVDNSTGTIIISWTNPQEQKTKIYNGDVLVATANEGETSVTLSELDAKVEYEFVVKGAIGSIESEGVTVISKPYVNKYPDTTAVINGVEVIGEGLDDYWVRANPWSDHYAWLYLTHESYEGMGALLIQSRSTDNAWAANWKNDKTGITAGVQYKIEYYVKPVAKINGEYTLPTAFRYYNDYTVLEAKVYDTKTGAEVTGSYESKWYRLESVFTATDSTVADWCGFSLPVSPGEVYIIDNLAMYANTGAEGNAVWTKLADKIGVYNGDFEAGMVVDNTAPYEVENFNAVAGNGTVTLSWDAIDETEVPDMGGYTLWNGNVKIAELDKTVLNYTVEGLENDVRYTFIIRAHDVWGNSTEGTFVNATPVFPEYEIGEFVMGDKVVEGTNKVSVKVTNNKVTTGMTAQLIIALFKKGEGLIKAEVGEIIPVSVGNSANVECSITIDDIDAYDYELRAFLWDSDAGMRPYTEQVVIGE